MSHSTTHPTDLPHRLRELSALRSICLRLSKSEELSAGERMGATLPLPLLFTRYMHLWDGSLRPKQLTARNAAIEEGGIAMFELKRLREGRGWTAGEKSGIREVMLAIEERHLLLPTIEEAEQADGLLRSVARDGGIVGYKQSGGPRHGRWRQWVVCGLLALTVVVAGMLVKFSVGR